MDIRQLQMFREVAERGSLRLSAESMHKTAPAISQGLRQLESSLGVELFSREGYRLVLTDAGKSLYQHAIRSLDSIESLQGAAARLAKGHEPSVTLAIEASFDLSRILPTLKGVQIEFPSTRIILRQEYLSGAIESVMTKDSTFCI